MSPHVDALSRFRANQSLFFLLNTACSAEKQQRPISLVLPDRGSNPRSTVLGESTVTITTQMRFLSVLFFNNIYENLENYIFNKNEI